MDFYQLEEQINITVASNIATKIKKQPVSLTIINREQIELSGARTLNELLTLYVPGYFAVEDQDDVITAVRGLAPDNNVKLLILVNGNNMNTEYFWGPPDAILQSQILDYIDHIEVIRGPGSVTLGQGAMLGVVNIVTKGADNALGTKMSLGYGLHNNLRFWLENSQQGKVFENFHTYTFLAASFYEGQPLPKRHYAVAKTYEGTEYQADSGEELLLADAHKRLKAADSYQGQLGVDYGDFDMDIFYADQTRSSYLFYRDRHIFQNRLLSSNAAYRIALSKKVTLKPQIYAAQDDFFISSNRGTTLGGTRENRAGGGLMVNITDLPKRNLLAAGVEFRSYMMGRENSNGDNYILNTSGGKQQALDLNLDLNENFTYVYKNNTNVFSFVLEDYYTVNGKMDLFAALRYDNHPGWGSNVSERLGVLYQPIQPLGLRLSYQEGFRGAPDIAYSGGYKGDGYLGAENYNKVASAAIPLSYAEDQSTVSAYYQNISQPKPEKMQSFEIAANYQISKALSVDLVTFFNIIQNVLDVGVIWQDKDKFAIPNLGSDQVGDWNGYWFYKNTEGEIKQAGLEIAAGYSVKKFHLKASHALVTLLSAPESQIGSMYVTEDKTFKAFPQNVTRLHFFLYPINSLAIGMHYLHYYQWTTPIVDADEAVKAAGGNLVNISASYTMLENKLRTVLSVKNLLNEKGPYPMNANAGGEDTSPGAPALEGTTFWITLTYALEN